ncbi:MAG: hypothetical protein ACRC3Y_08530 [Romboutsia sp.]|uniref:hypothetical protein n=1 Tax=Romboutsia sp. TaxID=1965302 RepID=UPI003F3AA59B
MKKYLNNIIKVMLILTIIISFKGYDVYALPYYDLKFEETSRDISKGEYEILGEDVSLSKDTEMTMKIKKSYEPKVSIELNKEEEDAISQVLGKEWKDIVTINKEDIKIKRKKETYIKVRPVYKEVKGYLVQDYHSWNKKKEITILLPIDVEYTLK